MKSRIPSHSEMLIDALDDIQDKLAVNGVDTLKGEFVFDVLILTITLLRSLRAKCPSDFELCFNQSVTIQQAAQAYADRL